MVVAMVTLLSSCQGQVGIAVPVKEGYTIKESIQTEPVSFTTSQARFHPSQALTTKEAKVGKMKAFTKSLLKLVK